MSRIVQALTLTLLLLNAPHGRAQPAPSDTLRSTTARANETDRLVAERLADIYGGLETFREVDATVHSGVVRLRGTVENERESLEAAAIASKLEGVLHVINELETTFDLEPSVTPAINRFQTYYDRSIDYLPVLGLALLVLILFWGLAAWLGRVRAPLDRMGLAPMVQDLVGRMVSLVVFIVGLVLALDILNITALVGTVLGAAGLAGIAIGFAFKDIIENYLAGLLLSVRRPFNLNEHVKIDSIEGRVLRLTSRELLLMTLDGNHVRLPNATVFKGIIYNYSRNPRRRFDFLVGIDVNEDLTTVSKIGLSTLSATRGVMEDPGPAMIIKELGDSNVVVWFFAWVDQNEADFGKTRSEAIRLVKTALDEAGIVMPEPIYIIRMEQSSAASEKARSELRTEAEREKSQREEPGPSIVQEAGKAEVAVDTALDEQIREDLEQSDEPNLLTR